MKNNEMDEKSDVKIDDDDKIDDRKEVMKRTDILRKAREAKKRKQEEKLNMDDHYNKNLENIHAHLKNLNTQITTIVECMNEKPKQLMFKEKEKDKEKEKEPESEKESNNSLISQDISYRLGEMIGVFMVAGGLYYFKTKQSRDPRDKYSHLI